MNNHIVFVDKNRIIFNGSNRVFVRLIGSFINNSLSHSIGGFTRLSHFKINILKDFTPSWSLIDRFSFRDELLLML